MYHSLIIEKLIQTRTHCGSTAVVAVSPADEAGKLSLSGGKSVAAQPSIASPKLSAFLDHPALTPHAFILGFRSQLPFEQLIAPNKYPIIDLGITIRCLRRACSFLKHLLVNTRFKTDRGLRKLPPKLRSYALPASRYGQCILVNSNPEYTTLVKQTGSLIGQKFINSKWIGGLLSREQTDCIIVFNANRNITAIEEAYRLKIPIIALVDSRVSKHIQRQISYPIPSNGESLLFAYILCNCIVKGVLSRGV